MILLTVPHVYEEKRINTSFSSCVSLEIKKIGEIYENNEGFTDISTHRSRGEVIRMVFWLLTTKNEAGY